MQSFYSIFIDGQHLQNIFATVVMVVESFAWKTARSETSRTLSTLSTEATPAEVSAGANILHLTALGINDRCRRAGRRRSGERGTRERVMEDKRSVDGQIVG